MLGPAHPVVLNEIISKLNYIHVDTILIVTMILDLIITFKIIQMKKMLILSTGTS